MSITIYHNPRCSKSRKTLEIIRKNGSEPEIIQYLEEPPDAATIEHLAALLGVNVTDLLRTSETAFTEAEDLPSLDDNGALAGWLMQHPSVLQRPIVVDNNRDRAVIGRPPENVLDLLKG
jgi:arsenate reductase